MRSCRNISALVSQGMDKKLSLRERFAVRMHLMMCTRCRNFQSQSRFIRKAARRYVDALQSRLDNKS
ncbi:putative zinc finger protein [Methylobacter tundripaludum]|uniref:Putative zinc finger protein n=1 Tax=Methylobacter tundripaludum TaxID=173365 RepID=A0A2S6GTP8_9GAMM|nr:zf-HC2 domain-containing protein [Methylobacter tundripaludum]PPK68628.1 putative zinc finger protein [Methylobacter tundripaludum]